MRKIKSLAWVLGFTFVCGLIVLPLGRSQLQSFISAHPGVPMYVWVALMLAIPGNLVSLVAAFLFEWLLIGWSRSSLKTLWEARASVRLDALSMAMTLLPIGRVGYILSLGLLFVIDTHSLHSANFSIARFLPAWGIQITFLVLCQSCISYWMHRLEHTIPALWALHKFHHSADRMSILNSERRTQLAKGVEEGMLLIPLMLLSGPTAAKPTLGSLSFAIVVIYAVFRTFTSINMYLCHSNLGTDYGWIGRWLLVSPRMHRLHHAESREYHDKNFTFDFVIWDRLFGTYATCDAATLADIPLGLEDNPFNTAGSIRGVLRNYFLTPYLVFWYELRKGFKAWLPERLNRGRGSPVLY
jgi:sterol desaturase/sphingolipid hydroxylase (fatty acid hydroxylase superfamily)